MRWWSNSSTVARPSCPCRGTPDSLTAVGRNGNTGDSLARAKAYTGPTWTKTSASKGFLPDGSPERHRHRYAVGLKSGRLADLSLAAAEQRRSVRVVRSDPEILGGTPVFVGTRVPVKTLYDDIEAGGLVDGFLTDFSSVTREKSVAVLGNGPSDD